MMRKRVIQGIFHHILICLFVVFLFCPALRMLFTEKNDFSFVENRELNAFPNFPDKLQKMPSYFLGIDTYLNDHFGFREFFIYRYQREIRKRFNITGDETKVHKGLNDWYYYTESKMLQDFAGKIKLSNNDLEKWADSYYNKVRWLNEQGIQYLLIVPPNKQSVYPEFISKDWREFRGKSRLEQLRTQHPEISSSELLDISSILVGKKSREPLYYQSDTHWTSYGAYLAYLAIAEKIEKKFPGISFKKEFSFTKPKKRICNAVAGKCGDLTRMLLDYDRFEESFSTLHPFSHSAVKTSFNYVLTDVSTEGSKASFVKKCPTAKLKAIVFRDSFFSSIEPIFSENFKEVIYVWKGYNQKNLEEILKSFTPDIVMEEIVERDLFNGI